MDLNNNLETIFSKLENMFKAKTVIGEQIVIGDVTLIPVVNISFGIGAGGGEGQSEKTGGAVGAGTGAKITPSAIIVVKGDHVSMLPLTRKGRNTFENLIEMVPEVVGRLKEIIKEDKTDEKEKF